MPLDNSVTRKTETVKAVENSIQIIQALDDIGEAGVTEIAKNTGISKGTVHKHLQTFLPSGLVVKVDDRYRLGLRFLEIGSNVRRQNKTRLFIRPKMKEVAKETGLLVHFCVEHNDRTVLLYRESTDVSVETRMRIGGQLPLHQSSTGKAILATYPDERVGEIIDRHGFEKVTDKTITDRQQLFDELELIRERGYATNISESSKGLRAVGATIFDDEANLVGALGIGGPHHQIDDVAFETEIPNLLLSSIDEIELNIAYSNLGTDVPKS